jgi:hypothetical protein
LIAFLLVGPIRPLVAQSRLEHLEEAGRDTGALGRWDRQRKSVPPPRPRPDPAPGRERPPVRRTPDDAPDAEQAEAKAAKRRQKKQEREELARRREADRKQRLKDEELARLRAEMDDRKPRIAAVALPSPAGSPAPDAIRTSPSPIAKPTTTIVVVGRPSASPTGASASSPVAPASAPVVVAVQAPNTREEPVLPEGLGTTGPRLAARASPPSSAAVSPPAPSGASSNNTLFDMSEPAIWGDFLP